MAQFPFRHFSGNRDLPCQSKLIIHSKQQSSIACIQVGDEHNFYRKFGISSLRKRIKLSRTHQIQLTAMDEDMHIYHGFQTDLNEISRSSESTERKRSLLVQIRAYLCLTNVGHVIA
nr:hypothetical transcript [Hymenolepis microstoma]